MNYIFRYFKKISCLLPAVCCCQAILAQMNPLSIGTVPAKDSVVIIYDVTINNPLPGGTMQISNQGSVSGTGFATFNTNDPKTPAAGDPTIVLLNIVLPVRLLSFTANERDNKVLLGWKAAAEIDLSHYEIERSTDGRTFTKIGEVMAENIAGTISYSFTDQAPFDGINFYRLRMVDLDGSAEYSQILRLTLHGDGQTMAIYPNPVIHSTFTLQFTDVPQDSYRLEVHNSTGGLVYSQVIKHPGRSAAQTISMGKITSGVYQVSIKGGNLQFTKTVVVQ